MSPVVTACHVGRAGTATWQAETLLSAGQANGAAAARASADGPFHPLPLPLPRGLSRGYHSPLLDERLRRGEVHVASREHAGDGRRVGGRLRAVITRVSASGSGPEAPAACEERSLSSASADVSRAAGLAEEEVVGNDEGSRAADVSRGSRRVMTRRQTGLGIAAVTAAATMEMAAVGSEFEPASAVEQVMLAGRIPGLSDPDENGLRTYQRPKGKSGGHGVGWSEMIPYSFKLPEGWEEVPVSIADLGGTEIDLRFSNKSAGDLAVVVAPVLRFSAELGDNVEIEKVGDPQKVINAFGPEVTGENVEGKVREMSVQKYGGRTYYEYYLEVPQHLLVNVTAGGNRLYVFSIRANGRQWKRAEASLRQINDSFRVG